MYDTCQRVQSVWNESVWWRARPAYMMLAGVLNERLCFVFVVRVGEREAQLYNILRVGEPIALC